MKETLGNAIGIFVVVDMFVVSTVLAGPKERRIFKRSRTEDQREEPDNPVGPKGEMRVKAMITQGNGKSAGAEHDKKKCDLEPVDAEKIQVRRHRSERDN